ncbi:Rut operon repressor [Raoultella planticola]|uniref:Rut operon repressor n=1 Tax=Raoultella planticola TaxID=575 RepID=A0A485A8R7_RAOPL|nr:Rut operon repressor [Raoultella planticola]
MSPCCSRSSPSGWRRLRAFSRRYQPAGRYPRIYSPQLEVSRDYPQASRLFCLEMLQGAPLLMGELTGDLKALVDEKSAIVSGWVDSGETGAGRPLSI